MLDMEYDRQRAATADTSCGLNPQGARAMIMSYTLALIRQEQMVHVLGPIQRTSIYSV